MIRKTLTILSLLGLLFSVGLWGLSYFHFVCWTADNLGNFVEISSGGIGFGVRSSAVPIPFGLTRNLATMKGRKIDKFREAYSDPPWKWQIGDRTGFFGYAGLDTLWLPICSTANGMLFYLMIPFWLPALAFTASLWLLVGPAMRRRKRKKLGLCVKCGYDLRASKDRCPECGTEFEKT